jgi:hypothetical protein
MYQDYHFHRSHPGSIIKIDINATKTNKAECRYEPSQPPDSVDWTPWYIIIGKQLFKYLWETCKWFDSWVLNKEK